MDNKDRKFINKKEIIFIVIIFIICGCFFVFEYINNNKTANENIAVVSIDGKEIEKFNLKDYMDKNAVDINLQEKYNVPIVLRLEKGSICFKKVDCSDQICVDAGWLKNEHDIAVCMPNKTSIVIYHANEI